MLLSSIFQEEKGRAYRSMEAPANSAGRFYRPELDAVRFLAFLLVFFHHILPRTDDLQIDHYLKGFSPVLYATANACGFGLTLFFTLSAFLICELLLRERQRSGTVAVGQFYIRRILRIWPLYYLALLLGVIAALLPGFNHCRLVDFAWYAIFMAAWRSSLYGVIKSPVLPLWSISVEEQFYFFAPWTVKYLNRKSLFGFCALLILVANALLGHFGRMRVTDNAVWFNALVQFECFAAGILLCLALHGRLPRLNLLQRVALLAGSWSCWFFACFQLHCRFPDGETNPGSWPLIGGYALASLGSALLLLAFLGINPKLLPRWAIYLGRISFGLYVYHGFALGFVHHHLPAGLGIARISYYPLKILLTLGLTIGLPFALTILIATISYRYFETPFLKMKKRHSVIESQPIAGTD
jgi:peptidoglycan/LPS O-acetylase OafA/YrhL